MQVVYIRDRPVTKKLLGTGAYLGGSIGPCPLPLGRQNSRAGHPLFGKKSSGAAAYRYSKKVAPLPLLARKTAAAAATFKK